MTQSEALLALIADLYAQIGALTQAKQELERQLVETQPKTAKP